MIIVGLDRTYIEEKIAAGNTVHGNHYLVIQSDGQWRITWADDRRQWNPWQKEDYVIGLPALFPEGDGGEYELAQECVDSYVGRDARLAIEAHCHDNDRSLVAYADEKHPEYMDAARENQTEFLFLSLVETLTEEKGHKFNFVWY